MSTFSKELRNPNDVNLACPHCGARNFHYRIMCDFEVFFTTENDDIDVYEREPGDTTEFQSIYCCECGKRAFTRRQLDKLGVLVPA